ncbi:MAG TPA: RNA-binding domain-containing protein [Pyrinomonadaceae bacterium]|nr:RNA-binding domain-containing protein [Pyrinomonadaceae bacterium]
MARRRFRSNQRHEPTTERSFQEYVFSQPAQQTSRTELMRLVRGGEDTYLELKVKLSNPEKIAQEIVALANTGGGLIVFGVSDQLRVEGVDNAEDVREELVRICREQIVPPLMPYIDCVAFDSGRRVVSLEVDGRRRPYRTRDGGRFYLRIGAEKREATREELSALLDEARPLAYENVPVLGAGVADIDEAHLWSYAREFEGDALNGAGGEYPTGDLLDRDLLLAFNDGNQLTPTGAGMLLFGRGERVAALLPRSSIIAVRYSGDTAQSPEVERVQLTGNLHTLYDAALRFVARYCDLWEARPRALPGGDATAVVARGNYHRDVIREGLANALTHRDLSLRDLPTRLHIFDRSIEITNPRRTAGFAPVAQRAIRYGITQRLNPQTAAIFSSPAYGLQLATGGLPMLLRTARLFANRRAEIHAFNDEFRLRIYAA